MKRIRMSAALVAGSLLSLAAGANASPVTIEIVGSDGSVFREFPVTARDDSLRSWLEARKGERYQVRVRNTTGERLGLVIAVDGRNIINGKRSELSRDEPMYVLSPYDTEDYAGWRASLDAINEFYFTDWSDSYAEAFGDRSARGVIAVAVYREVPPQPVQRPYAEDRARDAARGKAAPSASAPAGTGYGERREDHAFEVEFVARSAPDSRHFIKYEWHETLCRERVIECGETNRFWDESVLGFAPPPPRR